MRTEESRKKFRSFVIGAMIMASTVGLTTAAILLVLFTGAAADHIQKNECVCMCPKQVSK